MSRQHAINSVVGRHPSRVEMRGEMVEKKGGKGEAADRVEESEPGGCEQNHPGGVGQRGMHEGHA